MKLRKKGLWTAAVLAMTLMLSACGSSAADPADSTNFDQSDKSGMTAVETEAASMMETEPENGSDESGEDKTVGTETSENTAPEKGTTTYETMNTAGIWDTDTKDETMTLMVYMIGSDLESGAAAATKDMEEMAANQADWERLNVVIYTGGAQIWHSEVPADANAVLHLTADGFEQMDSFEQQSMGEAENLTRFLNYAVEKYPAENYGLVLWDHGNGPLIGYGMDKLYNNDTLTLMEIGEALEASPFGEDNKLNFIGFDACLMASVELVCTVSDYAEYLVASQEVEPSFGWNYDFLDRLGKVETDVLTAKIVNSYIVGCAEAFAGNPFFSNDATLASVDLSRADELQTAINDIFVAASEDVSGDYMDLAVERVETRALGRATTGSEYDLVDMNDLVSCMSERYPKECAAVQELLADMVVANESNTESVCGLSIYYPYYNKNYYKSSWKEVYEEMGLFPDYLTYLSRYEKIWLGTDMKEYFEGALIPKEGETGTYTLPLTEEQQARYAKSGYYVMRRTGEQMYQPVFFSRNTTMEFGSVTANFDGSIIYVKVDGDEFLTTMVETDTVDEWTYYSLNPSLTPKNDNLGFVQTNMTLALNNETGEVTIKSFTEKLSDEGLAAGKEKEIVPEEYSYCSMIYLKDRYLERDENGNVKPFFEWKEGDWITGQEFPLNDGIEFVYQPLYDDGYEYYIMFLVEDVQTNQYCSELIPISMANAPAPKEPVVTEVADDGTDPDGIVFYEGEGMTCRLRRMKDVNTGQIFYQVSAENRNDFPVNVYFEDPVVNDSYECGRSFSLYQVPAGETYYNRMDEIDDILGYLGEEELKSLRVDLSVRNMEDCVTLVQETRIRILPKSGRALDSNFAAYRGALVNEPTEVADLGDVKVSILQLGYGMEVYSRGANKDSYPLVIQLRVENKGTEDAMISVPGARINGIYMQCGQVENLAAGKSKMMNVTFAASYLEILDTLWGEGWEISDVELLIARNEESSWYTIPLSQSGTKTEYQPEGNPIYQDAEHTIYALGYRSMDTSYSHSDRWYFYVENHGPTDYYYDIDPETTINGEPIPGYGASLEGHLTSENRTVFYINYSEDESGEIQTSIRWSENIYDENAVVYQTDPITLSVEEGGTE